MNNVELLTQSIRLATVIQQMYDLPDGQNNVDGYKALDVSASGFDIFDVMLADELGYKDVPVGLLVTDLSTGDDEATFRGTRVVLNGPNEWAVDVQALMRRSTLGVDGVWAHYGFDSSFASFHRLSCRPMPPLKRVSGHSLAGAWALELATLLRCNCISFAGPRLFNRAGALYADLAIPELVRWVNMPDLVPDVPLTVWPFLDYQHVGPSSTFDSTKVCPDPVDPDPFREIALRITHWHALTTYKAVLQSALDQLIASASPSTS
jgi:hypothetical protein